MGYWFDLGGGGGSLPPLFYLNLTPLMYAKPPSPDSLDKYDEYRLHMDQVLKTQLIEFDFSIRILIPLEKHGIRTLGDLIKQTRESLSSISQIGAASLSKIEAFLEYQGFPMK